MIKAVFAGAVFAANTVLACETNTGVALTSQDTAAPDARIVLQDIPLAAPFSTKIILCNRDAVRALKLDAIMPAHQHGMNYAPTIADQGSDGFEVSNLLFHMPGEWEIRVDVTLDSGTMRYTHTVTVP